ncbi:MULTISPECIES: hypothetical protein [unclassified Flavobacterium]|uniref:hypothetical protein n=1 Tax=unclassified Flavobacterium TaxID=196869 RepID=UPI001F1473E4|nr:MULTISPECIES: hypothetical protein [unclassified Flavobacterium]UMY66180.1 hypothetical protein MKO97_02030 [Flavobacterium sp. HJ-32-4]
MKKKLEAELISIAHRILQMKNKSDLDQLYVETRRLYEKLAVMRFVEAHFDGTKPTLGRADVEALIDEEVEPTAFDTADMTEPAAAAVSESATEVVPETAPEVAAEETVSEPEEGIEEEEPVAEAEEAVAEEETVEEAPESPEPEEAVAEPEETTVEPEPVAEVPQDDPEPAPKPVQASFEDLLMHHYDEPVFVKAGEQDTKEEVALEVPETPLQPESVEEVAFALAGTPEPEVRSIPDPEKFEAPKPSPLADTGKAIVIGLNDRIGFEKNLFGGSSEDLNRVLSQLNTLATFEEAQQFIEQMVKPDYNNWTGKEDYEQRFLEVVERKFS